MHTRAPMLKTLSTFALRDGERHTLVTLIKNSILNPTPRNPIPLDRPLSLHPPPVNLLHRPLRPLQPPGPAPEIKIPDGPALPLGHHRRGGPVRRPRGGDWQPGRGHPRPHVRRRRQASRGEGEPPGRPPRAVAHRAGRGAGHLCEGPGPHGREERAHERRPDRAVGCASPLR